MRELDAKQITETVAQLCKEAAYYLPKDVYEGLKKGRETEKSPVGQAVLDQIIKNAEIARDEDRPYCQDTGMTIVFLEVGQDLHIVGGDLADGCRHRHWRHDGPRRCHEQDCPDAFN